MYLRSWAKVRLGVLGIYDKLMNFLTSVLFPNAIGMNVFEFEWDYLIVLDACRCDIFEKVYQYFFPKNVNFKCIQSSASSTMEFVRRNILESPKVLGKLKNVVFVNANPMIDHVLGEHIHKVFYKYIPVWRKYWNEDLGTVEPKHVYTVALKIFLKYPDKRMIIWFLQPHYPYVDKRFHHINVLSREFMNKAAQEQTNRNLITSIKILMTLIQRGYLCAGMPDNLCGYIRRVPLEAMRAYTSNLIMVLRYVKKLTEILPGKIALTSDHGEAFGEILHKAIPLRIYGHISRIVIPPLVQVPYLEIQKEIPRSIAIKNALSELLKISLTKRKSLSRRGT